MHLRARASFEVLLAIFIRPVDLSNMRISIEHMST